MRKQVSWLDELVTMGHWRTHDGGEVDLVLESDDVGGLAFEVRANERVSGKEMKGLRGLRTSLGDRFLAGVVLGSRDRSPVRVMGGCVF